MNHRVNFLRVSHVLCLLAVIGLSGPPLAVGKSWTGQVNNNWLENGNWEPAGVPQKSEDTSIGYGTPNITSGLQAFCQNLTLHPINGHAELTMVAGSELTVGNDGTGGQVSLGGLWYCGGTFNQNGGTHWIQSDLSLGNGADNTAYGIYNLNGGTLKIDADAYVGNNAEGTFVQTDGTNRIRDNLYIGYEADSTGSYTLSDGDLLGAEGQQYGPTVYVGYGATGTKNGGEITEYGGRFVQEGGEASFRELAIASTGYDETDLTGLFELTGGSLHVTTSVYMGSNGTGNFVQTGGTHTIDDKLYIVDGTYELSDPQSTNPSLEVQFNSSWDHAAYIGWYGQGAFRQSGGTVTVPDGMMLLGRGNQSEPGVGTYEMSGGSLAIGRELHLGAGGGEGYFMQTGGTVNIGSRLCVGHYTFVDGAGPGTYSLKGGALTGGSMFVRDSGAPAGIFQGWSVVNEGGQDVNKLTMQGYLENNGRVIADSLPGPGQNATDRTLDMSDFASVDNTIENPTTNGTNGWFAENHGKLVLKPITVSTGTGTTTYNWGETSNDTTIDLVNSVRLAFTNVSSGGDLSISLLATDRTDIASILPPVGWSVIGLWDFDPPQGLTFGGLQLTFRYDDAQAGTDEGKFIVIRYEDQYQRWRADVTRGNQSGEKDLTNNWLGGPVSGGLSYFAIAKGLSGDTNVDGDVDLVDLGALAGAYGTSSGATWSVGDFDVDGDVDLVDLGALAGNYGRSFGGDSVGGEESESQLDSEGTVTVVVDDGVDVGNGLTSYTVHLVADSAYNTVTAWEGSFNGTLHQVWMPQAFGHWHSTEMISDLDGWPEELVEVDSHFMLTDVITLGAYPPAEDNDRSEGQDPTYGTYAGVGTYLSGLFGMAPVDQDLVLAVIVIPANEEVTLTGTAANAYGDAFVTEATIPPAQ